MKNPFLPAILALLFAACAPAPVKQTSTTSPSPAVTESPRLPALTIRELRPGVWLHTSYSPDAARIPSNGLVVREGKQLVLVDTAWGEAATEELLEWIGKNLRAPVARAIVTHAHQDRMSGIAVLEKRNIPVMGHPVTRRRALAQGWHAPSALEMFRSSDVARVGFLEVYFPGPAHSPDNVVVWVAAERLLFGGCAIKGIDAKDLGNTEDADLKRWAPSLRRVEERYPAARIVVPGHGAPGGRELLAHTRELLAK